jgi:hypothetical protein
MRALLWRSCDLPDSPQLRRFLLARSYGWGFPKAVIPVGGRFEVSYWLLSTRSSPSHSPRADVRALPSTAKGLNRFAVALRRHPWQFHALWILRC